MSTHSPSALPIVHNLERGRFEAALPEGLARAEYRRLGNTLHMMHTEVPRAVEGRGIGGELVQAALDYADANGLAVMPLCSFVRGYMRRHPETHGLLAPGAKLQARNARPFRAPSAVE
jgi:predicted GNAT family acetyltransferase